MILSYGSGPQKQSEKSVGESGHEDVADQENILDAKL